MNYLEKTDSDYLYFMSNWFYASFTFNRQTIVDDNFAVATI